MDYPTWKLYKKRTIVGLSVISSLLLACSVCITQWAKLTIPKHQYQPKIGNYVGPANLTTLYLGLFTTSHGAYYTLFRDVNQAEIRKINIVASLLLMSVCATLTAGTTKMLAPRYCRIAKRYKGSALLNVFSVVLNIGSLVLWFWFTHGFTHGRSTLGALLEFRYCVFVMLSSCGLLIIVIALDFISCRRRRSAPLDTDMVISPTPSDESDVAPLNLSPYSPPPYQDLE